MAKSEKKKDGGFTARAFVLGLLSAAVVAWATVLRDAVGNEAYPSANLIPVMPYLILVGLALLFNPVLRRWRLFRPFSLSELLTIFAMCGVSCGLASWGFAGATIPRIAALSNPAWNDEQSEWDAYVMPFVNENYYISAVGSQAAARRLYEANEAYRRARAHYRAARELVTAREQAAEIEAEMQRIARIDDADERRARARALSWPRIQSEQLLELARETWGDIGDGDDPDAVAAAGEARIEELAAVRDKLRAELHALNADASEEARLVREGLPDEERAIPGFIFMPGETLAGYKARGQRTRVGSKALGKLHQLADTLDTAVVEGTDLPSDWPQSLTAVAEALDPLTRSEALETRRDALTTELSELAQRLLDERSEGRRVRQLRRHARQEDFAEYDEKIETLDERIAELEERVEALQERMEMHIEPELRMCERVADTQVALRQLASDVRLKGRDADPELQDRLRSAMAEFRLFDGTKRRFWLGDAPWEIWIGPLAHWFMLAAIIYLIFMTFNALVYRQWAYHEKLIYPIAEFTTLLGASGDEEAATSPSLFKSGLFWAGVAISAGILGWNHLISQAIIPNASPIKLQFGMHQFVGWDSVLRGIGASYFCIIFAVIGLTFLVPSSISFSLWFFELLYMVLLVVMAWMGYGDNRWSMGNPARSQVGHGAMLVFGLVVLWTCRHYLFCAFRPTRLVNVPADERRELRVSSALFLGASLVLVIMLVTQFGANPIHAVVYYLLAIILMITLMRAVTEGGVLSFEGGSVFALVTLLVGNQYSWWSRHATVPFILVGAVMFGSMKAFMAASMANAFRMREQMRMRRPTFHAAIWAGIVVTLLVASVTTIILCYDRGANSLDGWMASFNAKNAVGNVKGIMSGPELGEPPNPTHRNWYIVGIVMMAGLLIARQRVFGLPHPLGMVMLFNPVMYGFWGSILMGWLCKSVASKFCNKQQYATIRGFFVGLVVGHLAAVLFGWAKLDWHWG